MIVQGLDVCASMLHLLALACGDQFVRIYDRRKLSLSRPCRELVAAEPLMKLAPPHLAMRPPTGRLHATCVNFSNRGDKVLTTYHGDHAYAFDITGCGGVQARYPRTLAAGDDGDGAQLRSSPAVAVSSAAPSATCSAPAMQGRSSSDSRTAAAAARAPVGSQWPKANLSPAAEQLKQRGNHALFTDDGHSAISHFTRAIHLEPGCAVLYSQRGASYLNRAYEGDAAYALADLDTAVRLDPQLGNAYYRRIRALQALGQLRCALAASEEFRERFPDKTADVELDEIVGNLQTDIWSRRLGSEGGGGGVLSELIVMA